MLLDKHKLAQAAALLADGQTVFVPAETSGVKKFIPWREGLAFALDGANAKLPPKDILFPHTECVYTYHTGEDASIQAPADAPKAALFGIRPCDVQSILCMDKAFLENTYTDALYQRRRENTLLIALACPEAGETCFCDSMGVDPNAAPAADVLLRDAGGAYGVTAQSEKGEAVLKLWAGLLAEGEAPAGQTACTRKVPMSDGLAKTLERRFEDEIWREISRPCLGCGTCTYVCPTCYCFDIGMDNQGSDGTEFRCWDSCMFSDYNRIAGGYTPRPTKKERLRNRFLHKLSYFRTRNGMNLCVGCGRCVSNCPSHIDITEIIERMAEVSADA